MPITTASNLSEDTGRTFAIEVTGSPHQAGLRTGTHTLRVAYSELAKTIHSIGQRGGKIVNVKILTTPLTTVKDMSVAPELLLPVEAVASQQPTKATDNLPPESRRQQSKSKKR